MPDGEAMPGVQKKRTDPIIGAQREISVRTEAHALCEGDERFPCFARADAESRRFRQICSLTYQGVPITEKNGTLEPGQGGTFIHDILKR